MDIWFRTIRLSIKSLLLHPLRSALTVLGIFIGVASVIWLLAMGEGIGRAAQEEIASLGGDVAPFTSSYIEAALKKRTASARKRRR